MVATWLTELYLDQINRALLDTHAGVDAPDASSVEQLEQQLQVMSCFAARAGSLLIACAP